MSTIYRIPVLNDYEYQQAVASRTGTPPLLPNKGDRYLITSGTGVWGGHNNELTYYDSANWIFVSPTDGYMFFVVDEGLFYYWNGSIWKKMLHKTSASIDEMFIEVMA